MDTCLYISKLAFFKQSLKLLKKEYKVISVPNITKCPKYKIKSIKAIIVPMDMKYDKKILEKFSSLKILASPATGDIHIDKDYLKIRKIKFLNLKKNSKIMREITATSDLVFAFIFELTRKIIRSYDLFFKKKINFKKKIIVDFPLNKLSIGIIGLGRIGKHVAKRCKGLGMKVYFYDPKVEDKNYIKVKNIIYLFKKSNIVSLHLHYKKNLENIISYRNFVVQKKPSYFINTSRGEFLNENSLIKSLKNKILSGAALDVISNNLKFPLNFNNNKLLNFYSKNSEINLIITPKIGGSTSEARLITEKYLIDQIIKFKSI